MSAQELLEALGCCVLFGSPETAGKGEERSRERERRCFSVCFRITSCDFSGLIMFHPCGVVMLL